MSPKRKLKIALLVDWHSEKMGYSDNFLPRALAKLGHDVHLVSSNAQVYFNSPLYKDTFEAFLGPGLLPCGTKKIDGYTIHRLPIHEWRGRIFVDGLVGKLREIDPDIVQAGELPSLQTYRAALAKPVLGYKLFAECHIHASVFPAATGRGGRRAKVFWPIYYNTTGRLLNWAVERCFAISEDSADIVNRFFGISGERVEVRSLGVDTDLFRPFEGNADLTRKRQELRHRLGFRDDEVVAVYSGRLNIEKDPIFLAQAVEKLQRQGQPFRALFVGDGPREYLDSIRKCAGCVVHSFVPVQELPDLYRAADVGVWPKQESTSQLDAAACGLPLILSNQVKVLERVDGNGLLFEQGDPDSLATQLASLASADRRQKMGALGAKRMREQFSWDKIAMQYEQDYLRALH